MSQHKNGLSFAAINGLSPAAIYTKMRCRLSHPAFLTHWESSGYCESPLTAFLYFKILIGLGLNVLRVAAGDDRPSQCVNLS